MTNVPPSTAEKIIPNAESLGFREAVQERINRVGKLPKDVVEAILQHATRTGQSINIVDSNTAQRITTEDLQDGTYTEYKTTEKKEWLEEVPNDSVEGGASDTIDDLLDK